MAEAQRAKRAERESLTTGSRMRGRPKVEEPKAKKSMAPPRQLSEEEKARRRERQVRQRCTGFPRRAGTCKSSLHLRAVRRNTLENTRHTRIYLTRSVYLLGTFRIWCFSSSSRTTTTQCSQTKARTSESKQDRKKTRSIERKEEAEIKDIPYFA